MAFAWWNLKTEITFSKSRIMKHNLYKLSSQGYIDCFYQFLQCLFFIKIVAGMSLMSLQPFGYQGFWYYIGYQRGKPNHLVPHNSLDLGT